MIVAITTPSCIVSRWCMQPRNHMQRGVTGLPSLAIGVLLFTSHRQSRTPTDWQSCSRLSLELEGYQRYLASGDAPSCKVAQVSAWRERLRSQYSVLRMQRRNPGIVGLPPLTSSNHGRHKLYAPGSRIATRLPGGDVRVVVVCRREVTS